MYTSTRLRKSAPLREQTGYIVESALVQAFRNVAKELFSRSTNGSFTGYFSEPQRTECSMMWATPVSSCGKVRNPIAKVMLSSSRSSHARSAPFFSYAIRTSRPFTSGNSVTLRTVNPLTTSPGRSAAAAGGNAIPVKTAIAKTFPFISLLLSPSIRGRKL